MKVCMLAAENDALPGAKVGGIGDVIRDLPRALVSVGVDVSVVLPSYNALHRLDGMQPVADYKVRFRGKVASIVLYRLAGSSGAGTEQFLVHHPAFGVCGAGQVYCDDTDGQPFATDASKFALYCVAALTAIRDGYLDKIDVMHLHDWHAALAAMLKAFHPDFSTLQSVRCVFSIHNLALQGIRPLAQQASSLQAWFPELHYERDALTDPRWPHCVNPMVAGIRLADKVNTVSPGYAQEIIRPSNIAGGFHGGEGLEADLGRRASEGKLVGIINGIDYPDSQPSNQVDQQDWSGFCASFNDALLQNLANDEVLRGSDYVAHQRLLSFQRESRPRHLLTSVGRLTEQKAALFLARGGDGETALDAILARTEGRGLFIMLGSGDTSLEQACQQLASRHPHFIFINRYAQNLATLLYAHGDLFLMPSSFEPCGISQMLAMRAGQPCVVHKVGGLGDTVTDDVDGFSFSGASTVAQVDAFVARVIDAITLKETDVARFAAIAKNAAEKRFPWDSSARRYVAELYQ